MAQEIVIKVKNINKVYNLWPKRPGLGESISRFLRNKKAIKAKEFWALKNINFQIKKGEVVGIIGPNGAGKSTLLKIMSRITAPTKGLIQLSGRVTSLLEVGTGFNPELTGRENIYLNGAILGMNRKEIDQKFEQIVDFADIGEFLDMPVKHYSSGMYVRLAFAVAAHLNSEILLIDEVLAVGDAKFQKKCLGKTKELSHSNKTVLFVSHNMYAVKALCPRVIVIDKGRLVFDGPTEEAIHKYLGEKPQKPQFVKTWSKNKGPHNQTIIVRQVSITDVLGKILKKIDTDTPFNVVIDYTVKKNGGTIGFNIIFYDEENNCLLASINNLETKFFGKPMKSGNYQAVCNVPKNLFNNIFFSLTLGIFDQNYKDDVFVSEILKFKFQDGKEVRGNFNGTYASKFRPLFKWQTIRREK